MNNDGTVVNHIQYDGYGNITSESAPSINHIYGFTGRERDEESHLQFNRARYYDAAIGKWISEDPIGFVARDENLYRYVGNAATIYTDPSGMIWPAVVLVAGGILYFGADTANAPAPGDATIPSNKLSTLGPAVLGGVAAAAAPAIIGGAAGGVGAAGRAAAGRAAGAVAGAAGVGTRAVVARGLGAGVWPALLIDGKVYVARFHVVAWEMAGKCGEVQKYGMAIIDATGKVIGWK